MLSSHCHMPAVPRPPRVQAAEAGARRVRLSRTADPTARNLSGCLRHTWTCRSVCMRVCVRVCVCVCVCIRVFGGTRAMEVEQGLDDRKSLHCAPSRHPCPVLRYTLQAKGATASRIHDTAVYAHVRVRVCVWPQLVRARDERQGALHLPQPAAAASPRGGAGPRGRAAGAGWAPPPLSCSSAHEPTRCRTEGVCASVASPAVRRQSSGRTPPAVVLASLLASPLFCPLVDLRTSWPTTCRWGLKDVYCV